MKRKLNLFLVILSAVIITFLFHKKALGLNLFLFEFLLITWFIISKQVKLKSKNQIITFLGFLITSIFTILTHSIFSYIINFCSLFIFVGIVIFPEAKSLITSLEISLSNFFQSQNQFFKELTLVNVNSNKVGKFLWKSRIFLIPLVIILLFVFIYRMSNPIFDEILSDIGIFFQKQFDELFKHFDFLLLVTFLIGLIISNFIFLRSRDQHAVNRESQANDQLFREKKKKRFNFKMNALKNEYTAGVFLLIVLNVILFGLNIIDINWVWFNFKWEGQYLKQFVHEGTYLLILSIFISIVLVLYFFRNNLNFYTKNKTLKYLSYLWLAQNGILVISVAMRNLYYIQYFSLAYKRIGVILFLLLTLYGLYTVINKVKNGKSAFYLFRTNFFALYIIMVLSSLVNWDSLIAQYNFKHAHQSFLHLNYLSTLSDKSLPYLDKPLKELEEIDKIQKEKFPYEQDYVSPEAYYQYIQTRKYNFVTEWESKSILSWNLPEYLAYQKIKNSLN